MAEEKNIIRQVEQVENEIKGNLASDDLMVRSAYTIIESAEQGIKINPKLVETVIQKLIAPLVWGDADVYVAARLAKEYKDEISTKISDEIVRMIIEDRPLNAGTIASGLNVSKEMARKVIQVMRKEKEMIEEVIEEIAQKI